MTEIAEIPSAEAAIRAATETARTIELLKEFNDGPARGDLPELEIGFLESASDDELIGGRLARIGRAIEREFPGTVLPGFVSRFSYHVSCLAILLQDALAGFDGTDPATWCIRRLVDREPANGNPDYRNRFFELSHCLLTGETEAGFPQMPVRSTADDPQIFCRKLGDAGAMGFEYRMSSDRTITPISWGVGVPGSEGGHYRWPGHSAEQPRPRPSKESIFQAEEAARAMADAPVRIPVCYQGRIETRLPLFLGNGWDPRPDHRGDNAEADDWFTF